MSGAVPSEKLRGFATHEVVVFDFLQLLLDDLQRRKISSNHVFTQFELVLHVDLN